MSNYYTNIPYNNVLTPNESPVDLYLNKIYINPTSLSSELCSDIIKKFDKSDTKYKGHTLGGINTRIKDTTDLVLDNQDNSWREIIKTLSRELKYNIGKYADKLSNIEDYKAANNNTDMDNYKPIIVGDLIFDTFMAQKYDNNKGRYIYHNDFRVDGSSNKHRVMTFLWYLNDVTIGGETAFEGNYVIKPETGKLILFPASWTYPHCGKMPISNDKYIITGWIYSR